MRFLFNTLQWFESEFYGRVTRELEKLGHECVHVTYSEKAAIGLRKQGFKTYVLPALEREVGEFDRDAEVARIEKRYMQPWAPTVRDVYRTDRPCRGRDEDWCVDRTVRHFRAIEQIFDEVKPDVVVPEVGSEMMRTVTHLVGLERGAPVFFLLYTLFPRPLRLYRDTLHAPIVPAEEVRELSAAERAEVEEFIARFKDKAKPIREYRVPAVSAGVVKEFVRHVLVKWRWDRDNSYNDPPRMIVNRLREKLRSLLVRGRYEPLRTDRPFVYFPIHVTDDYKIKRVIPHCVDQASIIEQVAEALPHGYDIVLKEHPMSIGRNSLAMIRRLLKLPNVYLVDPYTSSHQLIQDSAAIVVISSTVGIEALLYDRPVLTLGDPFFAGFGVTLDVHDFYDIREQVPAVLGFQPDHERILQFLHAGMRACYRGKPVLVDDSDENARDLAESLDQAARLGRPAPQEPVLV